MGRYRYYNSLLLLLLSLANLPSCTCGTYTGSADLLAHPWLKDRRIFIDPGHGGGRGCPPHRTGAGGVCEDEVNLRVAAVLGDMLSGAGAVVKLSRTGNKSVSEYDRAMTARAFNPDLLISIHCAVSLRDDDNINYSRVFIWGGPEIQPASHDLAVLLARELENALALPAMIASDSSLYGEGGHPLLREARDLCPAALTEAGFITNRRHATRLRDPLVIERIAEAHFYAISKYCRRGIAKAGVWFSCPVSHTHRYPNLLRESRPCIYIAALPENGDSSCIDDRSLRISLDGVPAGWKRTTDGRFAVEYGRELYPGFHRLRFQFKNCNGQNSMIYTVPFTIEIRPDDYCRLITEGKKRIRTRNGYREGLRMLLSALSIEPCGPESRAVTLDIARGFALIGDPVSAEYYRRLSFSELTQRSCAINEFERAKQRGDALQPLTHHIMIDFHGTPARIAHKAMHLDHKQRNNIFEFIDQIKQFFSRQL